MVGRRLLRMLKTLLLLLAPLARQVAPAQDAWRASSLDLAVTIEPSERLLLVDGVLSLRSGSPTDRDIVLFLPPNGVRFDTVAAGEAAVRISRNRDTAFVRPRSRSASIIVEFRARTRQDLGRSLIRNEGAMISWGAGWYPSLARGGDPAEFEFPGATTITVPRQWRTLSVGTLTDSIADSSRRTDTWQTSRAAPRSVISAAYDVQWRSVGAARVATYLLATRSERSAEFAAAIPSMVRELERFFGPYPFGTFAIAELPREVSPPGFVGRSEPGYFIAHTDALESPGVDVPLFVHELAHMWFPNAVDSRPPGDDMVDEAIASYAVTLYLDAIGERVRARRELTEGHPVFSRRGYFHEARRGTDEPLMADYSPFIARAKGPLVYDMLHARIGDSAFLGVWRDLATSGGTASLADLRRLYQQRLPGDTGLVTFFSQWLDRTGAPVVRTSYRGAVVTVTQTEPLYQLALPVRVSGTTGTLDTVLFLHRAQHTLEARKIGTIRSIEIDPDHRVLVWTPQFGPPPDAPASWTRERWEQWMEEETAWLMQRYDVREAAVALLAAGRVRWSNRYGELKMQDFAARARRLAATTDTTPARFIAEADMVTLIARSADPGGGVIVVTARGGWGRYQLAMHLAQRVAIQHRWRRIPN